MCATVQITSICCLAGHCYNQLIWDFRNASTREYYVNTVVGSADYGIRNPVVSGMFFDDIAGLGTELPGLLEDLKWSPSEVSAWNAGANQTVLEARALMAKLKKFNWQQLKPMAAPEHTTCAHGGAPPPGGVGSAEPFRGLDKLCGVATGGSVGTGSVVVVDPRTGVEDSNNIVNTNNSANTGVEDIPWFLHVYPGRGIQPNETDCLPNCPRPPNMEQIIATFLLGRGDFAWMGYEYNGCADAMDSPYKNNGGMNYWAPSMWADVMAEDFGRPTGSCTASKTKPGVFERRYGKRTVSLDCNTWKASFD